MSTEIVCVGVCVRVYCILPSRAALSQSKLYTHSQFCASPPRWPPHRFGCNRINRNLKANCVATVPGSQCMCVCVYSFGIVHSGHGRLRHTVWSTTSGVLVEYRTSEFNFSGSDSLIKRIKLILTNEIQKKNTTTKTSCFCRSDAISIQGLLDASERLQFHGSLHLNATFFVIPPSANE